MEELPGCRRVLGTEAPQASNSSDVVGVQES